MRVRLSPHQHGTVHGTQHTFPSAVHLNLHVVGVMNDAVHHGLAQGAKTFLRDLPGTVRALPMAELKAQLLRSQNLLSHSCGISSARLVLPPYS